MSTDTKISENTAVMSVVNSLSLAVLSGAHKMWAHSDKKFSCPHCGYQTKTTQKLNEHIRIQHQLKGLKPYRCPYCSFTCATGGNTRKHIKQRHKGEPVTYLRDDHLLEAARVARKAGNTSSISGLVVSQENIMAVEPQYQEVVVQDFQIVSQPTGANSSSQNVKAEQNMTLHSYSMNPNSLETRMASSLETRMASANIDHQVQSISYVPSHSVYKLVNAAEVQGNENMGDHRIQGEIQQQSHMATLHPSLGQIHSGMQAHIVDASEIPVHENVIISSTHTLQPLVNVIHDHMQNL